MIGDWTAPIDWLEDVRCEITILCALSDAPCDDFTDTIGKIDVKMTADQQHRILVLDKEMRSRLFSLRDSLSTYLAAEERRGPA